MEQHKKDAIRFLAYETAKFSFVISLIFMFAVGAFNYVQNCEPPERWGSTELYDECKVGLDITRMVITAIAPGAIIGYIIIKWKKIKVMLKEQGFE